jgi:hypothetical protein
MDEQLTDAERDAIAQKFWHGFTFNGRPATWSDMSVSEQREATATWRAQHPVMKAPAASTPDDIMLERFAHALVQWLPGHLAPVLRRYTETELAPRLAEVESQFASALADALAASEAASAISRVASGSKGGDAEMLAGLNARVDRLRQEFDELKASTIASLERRASRHADHLASLESRTKSLERS